MSVVAGYKVVVDFQLHGNSTSTDVDRASRQITALAKEVAMLVYNKTRHVMAIAVYFSPGICPSLKKFPQVNFSVDDGYVVQINVTF